jgi:hypothetical protein
MLHRRFASHRLGEPAEATNRQRWALIYLPNVTGMKLQRKCASCSFQGHTRHTAARCTSPMGARMHRRRVHLLPHPQPWRACAVFASSFPHLQGQQTTEWTRGGDATDRVVWRTRPNLHARTSTLPCACSCACSCSPRTLGLLGLLLLDGQGVGLRGSLRNDNIRQRTQHANTWRAKS